jgi:hypothetical protein
MDQTGKVQGGSLDGELKQCKRAIRIFLRTAYTDERLTWLLAHARSGKLSYQSCCCLVGAVTADHPLTGRVSARQIARSPHYAAARMFMGAREAEWAFYQLGFIRRPWRFASDEFRRRRLVPMLLAEIRRRALPGRRPVLVWPVSEKTEKRGVKSCWQDEPSRV